MYKILLICLPVLVACHAATNNSPNTPQTATDTIAARPATTIQPALQAIKWSGMKVMTDETFKKEVLASSSLTLVDFNAEWCGPCKQLRPVLDKLVKQYDGKINFASVDVDNCPQAASNYQVSSIPLLAFYQNAAQGNTVLGLQSYEQLKQMIDDELQKR